MRWKWFTRLIFTLFISILLMGSSTVSPGDKTERVRAFTRLEEFDFVAWTLQALEIKVKQGLLGTARMLPQEAASQLVRDTLDLVGEIQDVENQIKLIYTDPQIPDPHEYSTELRARLKDLTQQRDQVLPLAEAILQQQVGTVISELGLGLAGEPFPPVLYHSTPIPMALVVSPRNEIRQQNNISLRPDITLEEQVALEDQVAKAINVSTLVVPIGGIGTYPTMIYQTTNLNWLAEVVAHEWIHNYLSLRPLGMNYLTSNELRTINETVANIAGKEIGSMVIERYYPELVPPPPAPPQPQTAPEPSSEPALPVFDFRAEMRETRITAEEYLAAGQIEEAEAYMEARRQFFWEHGYRIRKLNQAYFAFYGAYADQPGGGAAGANPVGNAVRELRAQSASLADFINKVAWVTSFEDLLKLLNSPPGP